METLCDTEDQYVGKRSIGQIFSRLWDRQQDVITLQKLKIKYARIQKIVMDS